MNLAYDAMLFAMEVHKDQKRKYTGDPYFVHLAEVAGIVSTVMIGWSDIATSIAISYLHDTMEDQGVTYQQLAEKFGTVVADGVLWLTDVEEGNRAERKAAACVRLSQAPGQIQTIKCADLISNTKSIMLHDPKFAVTYLKEKRAALEAMEHADMRLWTIAWRLANEET
jgi:(p)ppGpp synthase/HD superfamily hydrolase